MIEVERSAEILVNHYQSTNYHSRNTLIVYYKHVTAGLITTNYLKASAVTLLTKCEATPECSYDIIKQTMSQSFRERFLIYLSVTIQHSDYLWYIRLTPAHSTHHCTNSHNQAKKASAGNSIDLVLSVCCSLIIKGLTYFEPHFVYCMTPSSVTIGQHCQKPYLN
jgi:hypothetical protein